MEIRISNNKNEIFSFLSGDPALNLYLIGDLDDFFWPSTTWYVLYDNGAIRSIALYYTGTIPAALLLFFTGDPHYHISLLKGIKRSLPGEFTVHLSPGLTEVFGRKNILRNYGLHYRMILTREPDPVDDSNIRRLTVDDMQQIEEFYRLSYPDNWFTGRMVETGKYFGFFSGERLVGVSGIHVYSGSYSIAALGNIAVHPDFRGRKIAYKLTSALCSDLRKNVKTIGLNVMADNHPAIKCYENAGFEKRYMYDECLVRNA
ncbi:MAG: N-acetyltransferase [Bacteroidales bacterium]|jgi:ribosomal protein S18 acetylase RimI-like enzyme